MTLNASVISDMTFEAFVGDVFVHPTFSRGDRESMRVFRRALTAPNRGLPLIEAWRSTGLKAFGSGLAIYRIDESVWGEEVCFILVDERGRQPRGVGYYCEGELWLARAYRGCDLEIPMILCAAEHSDGFPVRKDGACLTPEEYGYHRAAYTLLIENARRRGTNLPLDAQRFGGAAIHIPTPALAVRPAAPALEMAG